MTDTKLPPLLLVGCGKMGGAMLAGWLEQGLTEAVVVEPYAASAAAFAGRVTVVPSADAIPPGFTPGVMVLAIKPQEAAATLPHYARFAATGALTVSIMAGRNIAGMQALLGAGAAVVRAMPNTPAAVGRGITVACANRAVSEAQRDACEMLLRAVGDVAWIEDESLIDPVTAGSGSGPANVFLLIEALAAAGVKAGLPEELAMRLARATVAGSGELAHRSIEPAAVLRRNVTSPGGTTEAALKVLMADNGLQPLLDCAIVAATRRARELAG